MTLLSDVVSALLTPTMKTSVSVKGTKDNPNGLHFYYHFFYPQLELLISILGGMIWVIYYFSVSLNNPVSDPTLVWNDSKVVLQDPSSMYRNCLIKDTHVRNYVICYLLLEHVHVCDSYHEGHFHPCSIILTVFIQLEVNCFY